MVFVFQVLEGDSSSARCGQTEHQHNQFSMSDPTHWLDSTCHHTASTYQHALCTLQALPYRHQKYIGNQLDIFIDKHNITYLILMDLCNV